MDPAVKTFVSSWSPRPESEVRFNRIGLASLTGFPGKMWLPHSSDTESLIVSSRLTDYDGLSDNSNSRLRWALELRVFGVSRRPLRRREV